MEIVGFSNIELIYSGVQSCVYKAVRDSDQLVVALKVPSTQFPDPRQISVLNREYQVLNKIQVAGVPKVIDFMEIKNSVVVIREWIDGISLREYEKANTVSIENALRISIDIAQCLGLVHRGNYCHRDISAGNVLIDPITNNITLIDFGSSIEFPNRARNIIKPKFVEGSIAYMSPEQTGRMNKGLDFRTDFYSFGVLLYELFTGQLPFDTKNTNELIHSHIALDPQAPTSLNPQIPTSLSNIILKLMSKSPDARYQSAEGVQADLELCLKQWSESNKVVEFELGAKDLHDYFIIPDKVYGRQNETAILTDAYEQATKQNGHLVFISGYSGVGKTSLVKELHRLVVVQDGYIASGKYDQLQRHQPYSAILQALTSFIRQVMSEEQSKIAFWREKILHGIGGNGRVLFDVLPELELLIGEQPTPKELSMEAAATRFNTTFYNFIHVLGYSDIPLILFIDDLQWIDASSLTLLEAIAPAIADSSLLIIGAYRDNEVANNHPLMISMPSLKENCSNISTIELKELPPQNLVEMLNDTIELPHIESEQLSKVLYQKTNGNPFIFKAMLTSLFNDAFIQFDYEKGRWRWDQDAVEQLPQAENVLEVLQANMVHLPQQTVSLLKFAGCIGNVFNLKLLTSLTQKSRAQIATDLIPAVVKGYIQPLDDDFELLTSDNANQLPDIMFRFVHDRIQHAAYSLIPHNRVEHIHWIIGQELLKEAESMHSDPKLFDAIEHLNQGGSNITEDNCKMLVNLNLKAGKKAKQSSAFSVAYSCLKHAKEITSQCKKYNDLALNISVDMELAQACYLVGEFELAESLYVELDTMVSLDRDKLHLANIKAKQYHHQGEFQKSVEYEYEALKLLGIELPKEDEALLEIFAKEKEQIESLLKETDLDQLYQQSEVSDADFIMIHELLFDTFTDGYLLGKGALLAAVASISTRLSIERGNCAVTSVGYINYATVLCSSGQYKQGHDIGRLAIRLADKYQNAMMKNYTYHVFSLGINHWLEPLHSSYNYWHEASKLSVESGSPYAGWVFLQLSHLQLASQVHLDKVETQMFKSQHYLTENRLGAILQLLDLIVQQPLRHLKGETHDFSSLDDDNFSTQKMFEQYKDEPFFLGHVMYSVLRASLLSRNIISADKIEEWLPLIENIMQAQIMQVDSCMYACLHLTAECTELSGEQRENQLIAIEKIISKFEAWSELCPKNFKHKYLLLKAEWFRLHEQHMDAFDQYELARELALEHSFLMDAALTDELAGLFWLSIGKSYQGQSYLRRALAGYEQWGAKGKVRWMKENFTNLVTEKDTDSIDGMETRTTIDSTLGTENFSAIIDMNSVIKASQAVSQYIHVDELAKKLLNIAVENAGASRGLLLLEQDGEFVVTQKISTKEHDMEGLGIAYTESHCLSRSIVRYVINSSQSVLYTPKAPDEQFERCPYLVAQKEISVLCVPLIRQNKMSGMLYLENTHVADAFQSDRLDTLKIIASQAAISFENARIYQDLETLNKNLEKLVDERTQKLYEANQQLTEKNEKLYVLSTTDQLTGLYNRRYVDEQLHLALERKRDGERPFSVLMLDVDHFKSVNDTYGHDIGDRVLKNIATAIQQAAEKSSICGRWGGEEFIILYLNNIDGAIECANTLRALMVDLDNTPVENVTISVGVTHCLIHDNADSILTRVDEALYEAKSNGRDQIVVKTENRDIL